MKENKDKKFTLEDIFGFVEDTTERCGLESIELAELYLSLDQSLFANTSNADHNVVIKPKLVTPQGHTFVSPTVLDWYIFSDSSLTDARLRKIHAAFAFAIPTWSQDKPDGCSGPRSWVRL